MMASTKVTFVTGTAEIRRKDPNWDSYHSHPEQRLTTEPNTPLQVTYVDGKCTCCPYGYHIDLDFLNFCRDLEKGSTLKNLKRIQRTKRKLRKSMEMMLGEQEGFAADPNSAPPDVVHSTEAGRLMHMINYERSATHNILHHIDSSVGNTANFEMGAGQRYISSDSDESNTPYTPPHGAVYPFDESNRMTTSYSTLERTDSFGSLSSVSTMSNEAPLPHHVELQHQQLHHHSLDTKTTTKVVENPVVEMGTAEMKHYSITSSAQLADFEVNEPVIRSTLYRRTSGKTPPSPAIPAKTPPSPATPAKTPSQATSYIPPPSPATLAKTPPSPITPSKTPPATLPRSTPDTTQMSLSSVREAMAVSLQRMRELEEQVKTIPILQVRISVLKEEKRLLNLQLKASKTSAKPPTTSLGVGDGRVDIVEKMEHTFHSPRTIEFPKSYFADASFSTQKYPLVKSPPLTLPKPVRMLSSVGVGDHNVTVPYILQPDLPSRENETFFEIHSRAVLEQASLPVRRVSSSSLNMSFQHSPNIDAVNREMTVSDSSQPLFTINQIQRSAPKALTRTVGTGDGNVFDGSGLHVHEKELRTVIIGQNNAVAKRNVGIECRVATRDVGVLFKCDEEKPETRTVGVNVNYDTSGIYTSLDFKGETELRLALRDVLHRNLRSIGTNCNFKPSSFERGTDTDQSSGVSVACGDESHRVDVEVRPATVKKSIAVAVKPETGNKCVSTDAGWVLEASTNTYQVDTYHKSIMTDKQKQAFACTNTEQIPSYPASCQTEHRTFISLDQVRHAASNTEQPQTYSTGISTDIVPTFSTGVNTTEKVSDLFQEPSKQKGVIKTKELKSILKKPKAIDSETSDDRSDSVHSETAENSRNTQQSVLSTSKEITSVIKSEYVKKSLRSDDGKNQISRFEISTRSGPVTQDFVGSREELLSSSQEDLDKRNSAFERFAPTKSEDRFLQSVSPNNFEDRFSQRVSTTKSESRFSQRVSPTKSEDRFSHTVSPPKSEEKLYRMISPTKSEDGFSETVVEHYLTTHDGKQKLISQEKTTTSSLGTNRRLIQYPDKDRVPWSDQTHEPTMNRNGSQSFSSISGTDGYSTSASSSYSSSKVNGSLVTEKNYATLIKNPYLTVENLAVVSSILDCELDNGLGLRHISKTASEDNLYRENRERKSSQIENASSGEAVYDMRRAGSVEDFMPDDIRRYMSIDPSASKDSGFGEDLIQRFSEELSESSSPSSSISTQAATSDATGMRSVKTVTTKHATVSGDKVVVQETKTVKGSDGQTSTTFTETSEDGRFVPDGGVSDGQDSCLFMSQGDSETLTSSPASRTHSSSRVSGQGGSDSNLLSFNTTNEHLFTERAGFTSVCTKSFSETAMTAVGDSDEELVAEIGSYGSLDRKTGKLKSIMKRRSSDSQQISCRKGITFAESVTGGTGSSSQEENENTSDSDSSTSYEEGSYDGQQGQVIYFCTDDKAIAQGLPGAQMFDQNIRETYELPNEVREACTVLATYLVDSTSIQTKQLNASQNTIQQEWTQVSSHKLSVAHQVEDFLSSVNEISKKLLEYIINMTDNNGNTAIHYCISHCNFEITSLLLDSEVCDINRQNKAGYTPIMLAGLATLQNLDQREVVRRLFSLGDVNARAASTQQTALMLAASHGRTEMVKLLVEEGADINLQDEDGSTALMCACEHGYLDIVNFLLAQPNIDANITDNENSTALSIAMEAGHKDVGVVLYKHLNFSKTPTPASQKRRRSSSSPTPSNFSPR